MDQPNESSENSKTILAVIVSIIVTAVIVGGGVYYWQNMPTDDQSAKLQEQISALENEIEALKQTKSQPVVSTTKEAEPSKVALYTDSQYGFKLTAPKQCKDHLSIEKDKSGQYILTAPKSDFTSAMVVYEIMTQKEYNEFSDDELPGKPKIELKLNDDSLLTARYGHDWPLELPEECNTVTAKKN